MKNILFILQILGFCCMLGCTHDDPLVKSNDLGSSLEIRGSHKVSWFSLPNKLLQIGADDHDLSIELTSHSSGEVLNLTCELKEAAEKLVCAILIPKEVRIVNSDYSVLFRNRDGAAYGARFIVTVRDEMFHAVLDEKIVYRGLDGSGDENDPYLIGTTDQYYSFLSNLLRDSLTHAANLHFMQTASFDAPSEGHIAENSGYAPFPFAGHYNGGGFSINELYYAGTGGDTHVGLFSELLNGTVIQKIGRAHV